MTQPNPTPAAPLPGVQPTVAGAAKLPDARIRQLIAFIVKNGPSAFTRDSYKGTYGANGAGWPAKIPTGLTRDSQAANIVAVYLQSVGKQPILIPQDPGAATAGLGPTGIGFGSIGSVLDFLKLLTNPATWLRVAEVALGMLLVAAGLAKMSQRAAVVIRQVPVAGKVLT